MDIMIDYDKKCLDLKAIIDEYTNSDIMVAFSGGVDSSLLLKMACESAALKSSTVYAVTMHTMLHPKADIDTARRVAGELEAVHYIIEVDELNEAGILNNPTDRCYLCKKHLFEQIKIKAAQLGVNTIIEGTNEDDLHVYRPGIKALKELGIKSPLAKAGITKEEVRRLAGEYGVSVQNRPSTPCLATRFPYGTALSYEGMRRVERAEAFVKGLGLYNVRVRVHNELARIEVDTEELQKVMDNKNEITAYLKELGYAYITVDLEGFRSGSMDINVNDN